MKILLLYDNFIRDFRGLLLLKHLLARRGHNVWIRGTWNNPIRFAKLMDIDVLVGGQIAETATYRSGKFAKENHIRFVLNSTENVGVPSRFDILITYNTSELNDGIIDLQSIASKDVFEFIMNHPDVKPDNKKKYKFIGFPRLDLTINESFRNIETTSFRKKYNIPNSGKVYLFISSFLLEGAFDGVPKKDLDRWNYTQLKKRTDHLLQVTSDILSKLVSEILGKNDVLLIKKHPWDCSPYFKDNFQSKKCVILDNNDYIVPCIVNAEFIIHTYSTAVIEAWILGKKTISILLDEYKASYTLNHMNHELSVSSFEELKELLSNYPAENPSVKSLEIFAPNLDGKATLRLAEEIHKLTPHPHKKEWKYTFKKTIKVELREWFHLFQPPSKSKLKTQVWEWLYDRGFLKRNLKDVQRNTKRYDFISWENDKPNVIKRYDKHFKRYAKKYIKEGL